MRIAIFTAMAQVLALFVTGHELVACLAACIAFTLVRKVSILL